MNRKESMLTILDKHSLCVDFFNLFCGELIGTGAFRHVYDYERDNKCVIKIETSHGNLNNAIEYNTWQHVIEAQNLKYAEK